ncbi:MAG TPA: OsmC family peroxiredoxin [Actinomycetota bacterium]|nr:OsmC family peroxiredoxin [Actinomycetota bacterium]
MTAERRAQVTWEGNLFEGSGRVALGSGVTGELPVTWAARTEESDGKTSPEELIAGAQAACFAMFLSNVLAKADHAPERLDVTATSSFDKKEEGWRLTAIDLEVRGNVPGIEAAEFEKHAETAKEGCPVSNALKGNVEIRVKASFI